MLRPKYAKMFLEEVEGLAKSYKKPQEIINGISGDSRPLAAAFGNATAPFPTVDLGPNFGSKVGAVLRNFGIGAALLGSLATGANFGAGVIKDTNKIFKQNAAELAHLKPITSKNVHNESLLGFGVDKDLKIITGQESKNVLDSRGFDTATGLYSPKDNALYVNNVAESNTILHELSHANEKNFAKKGQTLNGMKGDYKNASAMEQLGQAYKDLGYTDSVSKRSRELNLDTDYWTKTNEMTSRLAEKIGENRGAIKKGLSNTDAGLYPSADMVKELTPLFDQVMHDSSIVRASKSGTDLTKNYSEILKDVALDKLGMKKLQRTENNFEHASDHGHPELLPNINKKDKAYFDVIQDKASSHKIKSLDMGQLNNLMTNPLAIKDFDKRLIENEMKSIPGVISRGYERAFNAGQITRAELYKNKQNYLLMNASDPSKGKGSVTNAFGAGVINVPEARGGINQVYSHSSSSQGVFDGALSKEITKGYTTDSKSGRFLTSDQLFNKLTSMQDYDKNSPIFMYGCNFANNKQIQELANRTKQPVYGFEGFGRINLAAKMHDLDSSQIKHLSGVNTVTQDRTGLKPGNIKAFYPTGTRSSDFDTPLDQMKRKLKPIDSTKSVEDIKQQIIAKYSGGK